ncbi:ribonucleoside-diphosphate reductase, adenosylcobalamin-dependent [Candidatus Micrarchaeota archaeon RBG_16_49_10]|nr:MAG: ribonucleoside-diphosphate reductase, adenosylcobalamin-dependent [Candidatus Micrarchaeota archaeon RBG_16_49_10]
MSRFRDREGNVLDFDRENITQSIWSAVQSVGGEDRSRTEELSEQVFQLLKGTLNPGEIPNSELIQDMVEKVLIESGHAKVAKAYIIQRQRLDTVRRAKASLGIKDDMGLSLNALTVLKGRYLRKDNNGGIIETPKQMFERVARTMASVDKKYGKSAEEVKELEGKFYDMMVNFEFLPNSPTLMNAGTKLGQLSACFVLPIEDSVEGIYGTLGRAAITQKSGGGTGFSFSKIRPREDVVQSTGGIAAGPLFFMEAYDLALRGIRQGFRRYSTNMGVLRVDHPDILDFIMCKETEGKLATFNISVAVTDKFMKAVLDDKEYDLVNPRTSEVAKRLKARAVWNLIVTMAWKNGEPGILFIDRMNKKNPTSHVEEIEATNPCGEQPLGPYESCNLGSINLHKALRLRNGEKAEMDWERLRDIVHTGVHFLDNVIDANVWPIKESEEMAKANRRIGLGVMGFADMLIELGIPYDSEEAVKTAEKVMKFVHEEGLAASEKLGVERGSFPNFKGSLWDNKGYKHMRNATITTVAPTGTTSLVAGCSQSIEPLFAISYMRNVQSSLGRNLVETNPIFERVAIREGFYSDDLMERILKEGSIHGMEEMPKEIREVFVTMRDIIPEWHVRIQAAFQKHTDSSVSKTVNFPNHATPQDIERAYLLAYQLKCKGITVYRDGSRALQVLNNIPMEKADSQVLGGVND